jgi:hypothetical protein
MKLKFLQSTFVAELDQVVHTGDEAIVENKEVAESLVSAGYAETVIEEKPSVKKARTTKEDGDK